MKRLKLLAERSLYRASIDIVVMEDLGDGRQAVAVPCAFLELEPEKIVSEPTLRMRPEDAQCLMDELWRCGLRPTEGTGSAGSLAATERHLKDMQRIVFHLLADVVQSSGDTQVRIADLKELRP